MHLLLRAHDALDHAAADLTLSAVLTPDAALAGDLLVLSDAVEAELEALVAAVERHLRR